MVLPSRYATAQPTFWYDRTDIPDINDPRFKTLEEWQAAMDEYLAANNTPLYQGDTTTTYTRPDGSTGEWFTAGLSTEHSPNAGLSEGQIAANRLNRMVLENPESAGPGASMRIQAYIKSHPEEALAAYLAVDKDGTPILDDGIAALMEDMGLRPPEELTQPPVAPDDGGWTQNRLGYFNRRYLDEAERTIGDDGRVSFFDPKLVDNMERLMAETNSNTAEAQAHIIDFMTKNGWVYDPEGQFFTKAPTGDGLTPRPEPGGEAPGMTPRPEPGGQADTLEPAPEQGGQQAPSMMAGGPAARPSWLDEVFPGGISAGGTAQGAITPQSTTADGAGPENGFAPTAEETRRQKQLVGLFLNSRNGLYPEWMQIGDQNRGVVGGGMRPAGQMQF